MVLWASTRQPPRHFNQLVPYAVTTLGHNYEAHIVASPALHAAARPGEPAGDGCQPPSPHLQNNRPPNLDNPGSHAFTWNVFKKTTHPDSSHLRNRRCLATISPFPTYLTSASEWVEICFGHACKTLRYPNPQTCLKIHLEARDDLSQAPLATAANILRWLARPAVRERIRLTDKAATIPCFLRA